MSPNSLPSSIFSTTTQWPVPNPLPSVQMGTWPSGQAIAPVKARKVSRTRKNYQLSITIISLSLWLMKTPSESGTRSTNGLRSVNKGCAAVQLPSSEVSTPQLSNASKTFALRSCVTEVLDLNTLCATELFIYEYLAEFLKRWNDPLSKT